MKVLELFAGTSSVGRAFRERGHEVFTVEWDRKFYGISLYADVGSLRPATKAICATTPRREARKRGHRG